MAKAIFRLKRGLYRQERAQFECALSERQPGGVSGNAADRDHDPRARKDESLPLSEYRLNDSCDFVGFGADRTMGRMATLDVGEDVAKIKLGR